MKNNNCLLNLLKLIVLLQNNSINNNETFGCDKNYLGPSFNYVCYNTRVLTLYNKQGNLITTNYGTDSSSYYRVNRIMDNCVELLILRRENDTYYSTNQFITINMNCICAIKCISDVYVNCS